MFEKNRILHMLEQNQIPLGMQCFTGDPTLIEIMGITGFDWVMLDSEHSGNNPRAMEHLIRAAECVGLVPFVRVTQSGDEVDIHRVLEAGAKGIFLPQIDSVEDVKRAAEAAFFPPKGNRGVCPAVRAAYYNDKTFVDYTTWNNSEILLIPMIENPSALADVEAICAHPDVHIIVFAAGDLGFSLNEGLGMLTGPKVSAAYKQVLAIAKHHNVAVIGGPILSADAEGCKKALEDGITIFSLGLDSLGFRSYCQQMVNALDQRVAGSNYTRPPRRDWGFSA